MVNPLHDIARAMNADRVDPALLAALSQSWCAGTCWDGCRSRYREDNPSWGQCLVSSLVVWADGGFRDTLVPCFGWEPDRPAAWHFQLLRDGEMIDVTAQQFAAGTRVEPLPYGSPDAKMVIAGSFFDAKEDASLRARLALLLRRMAEKGYALPHDADSIIDRIRDVMARQLEEKPHAAPFSAGPSV